VGMPRSGTTLVEQILASHPAVHGAGELGCLRQIATALEAPGDLDTGFPATGFPAAGFPECLPLLPDEAFARLRDSYLARVWALAPAARRITDRLPGTYQFVGLIRLILPQARIIHVTRDPVDTCLSCFCRHFAGSLNFTYDLAELGRYYRLYAKLM